MLALRIAPFRGALDSRPFMFFPHLHPPVLRIVAYGFIDNYYDAAKIVLLPILEAFLLVLVAVLLKQPS